MSIVPLHGHGKKTPLRETLPGGTPAPGFQEPKWKAPEPSTVDEVISDIASEIGDDDPLTNKLRRAAQAEDGVTTAFERVCYAVPEHLRAHMGNAVRNAARRYLDKLQGAIDAELGNSGRTPATKSIAAQAAEDVLQAVAEGHFGADEVEELVRQRIAQLKAGNAPPITNAQRAALRATAMIENAAGDPNEVLAI